MMLRTLSVIIVFCSITSCATLTPVTSRTPKIVLPPDPVTRLSLLNDQSSPADVMKAWVAATYAYRDWNHIVRKQIADLQI